jgi:short-subunit dehydrogenase
VQQFNGDVQVETESVDLSNEEQLLAFSKKVRKNKKLGILVNNAGMLVMKPFFETEPERLQSMMKLNNNSICLLTKQGVKAFKKQLKKNEDHQFGLVQLSSSVSYFPMPYGTIYAATKRFDQVFARSVAYNLSGQGVQEIDSVTITPGLVDTALVTNFTSKGMGGALPEETSQGTFKSLGLARGSAGAWQHEMIVLAHGYIPTALRHWVYSNLAKNSENAKKFFN